MVDANHNSNRCPDEQTLLDFLAGRLSGQSTTQIRTHVSSCPVCNAIATDLIRDAASHVIPTTAAKTKHYELHADSVIADKYQLVHQLGEGGMGTVWEAKSVNGGGRHVAIKLLKAFDVAAKKRFLREIANTARLVDPGLVRVVDVIEDVEAGTPALVMELLDGVSLAARLKEDGRIERQEAIGIARELARTLGVVHGAGLVHRDVKPANIQLTSSSPRRVVLLDLGLATSFGDDQGQGATGTMLTRTGQAVGTPEYMAPERLAGEKKIDGRRADLWSLGVVLYECITGTKPFPGRTVAEVLRSALKGPPLPLLLNEAQALLQPDPADRPASAEATIELLARMG